MKLLALAFAAAAMAGCASFLSEDGDERRAAFVCEPEHREVPCGPGAEAGVPYRFDLLTHCGIEWAYFDGRYWVPRPRVDPPSRWAAVEGGTMVLERDDVAVFEADEGGGARFVPAPAGYRPEACA